MNRLLYIGRRARRAFVFMIAALLAGVFLVPSSLLAQEKAGAQQEHVHKATGDQAMKFKIPSSLKSEHEELHAELARAIQAGGQTGKAAKIVANLLHPHFMKEEEYALPPLGLLPLLAKGEMPSEAESILALTDKLKAELQQMLEEHRRIVAALNKLSDAARKEKKTAVVRFTEKLMHHAENEEEVLYPTSILVGEYLKCKLQK